MTSGSRILNNSDVIPLHKYLYFSLEAGRVFNEFVYVEEAPIVGLYVPTVGDIQCQADLPGALNELAGYPLAQNISLICDSAGGEVDHQVSHLF